jgi:hypothetical protein
MRVRVGEWDVMGVLELTLAPWHLLPGWWPGNNQCIAVGSAASENPTRSRGFSRATAISLSLSPKGKRKIWPQGKWKRGCHDPPAWLFAVLHFNFYYKLPVTVFFSLLPRPQWGRSTDGIVLTRESYASDRSMCTPCGRGAVHRLTSLAWPELLGFGDPLPFAASSSLARLAAREHDHSKPFLRNGRFGSLSG